MKRVVSLCAIFIILMLVNMFAVNLVFASPPCISAEINNKQPISIGEIIYSAGYIKNTWWGSAYDGIQYVYRGVENNVIQVKYEYGENDRMLGKERPKETNVLSLPLNANKQTLLKTKKMSYSPSEELVITIVDDFNRISVKKYQE